MLSASTFNTFASENPALEAEFSSPALRHKIQRFCVRELGTRSGRSKSNYFEALKRFTDL
jgi:hypothetical protein